MAVSNIGYIINESSAKEIEFLKARAEEGSPLSQFNYGLYFLLFERDEKTAEESGGTNSSIAQMVMAYGKLHVYLLI